MTWVRDMAKRFWCSNRDYCQLIYEKTGLLPKRVAYASDVSQYYLYYDAKDCASLKANMQVIRSAVSALEGAEAVLMENGCLQLMFLE